MQKTENAGGRIRTFEGTKPRDLESRAFNHFATPARNKEKHKFYKPCLIGVFETAIVAWSHPIPFRTRIVKLATFMPVLAHKQGTHEAVLLFSYVRVYHYV